MHYTRLETAEWQAYLQAQPIYALFRRGFGQLATLKKCSKLVRDRLQPLFCAVPFVSILFLYAVAWGGSVAAAWHLGHISLQQYRMKQKALVDGHGGVQESVL